MTETINKTLEATLAPPTQHKERKLRDTLTTYREALHEAFNAGCTTMSETNDIVTPYDLAYQAKDALKRYVPQLHRTYDARELDDDHPVRFTNKAAKFDYDESREHGVCWNAPRPGRGTNFWIPLRLNPDQRDHWMNLLDDDHPTSAGNLTLQQNRTTWTLYVSVKFPVETTDHDAEDGDVTHIGLDIGESALITGCALKDGSPTNPFVWNGCRARQLRDEMHTTLKRLQERDAADWRRDSRFDYYQNALTDIVEKASRAAVDYAQRYENPVLVMEDLAYIRENLDYGAYMNRRLHNWAFARLQGRVEDKAREAGVPVKYVNPEYTSQTCHWCHRLGRRDSQAEFRCTNDDCHVSAFQADINAAANIAQR